MFLKKHLLFNILIYIHNWCCKVLCVCVVCRMNGFCHPPLFFLCLPVLIDTSQQFHNNMRPDIHQMAFQSQSLCFQTTWSAQCSSRVNILKRSQMAASVIKLTPLYGHRYLACLLWIIYAVCCKNSPLKKKTIKAEWLGGNRLRATDTENCCIKDKVQPGQRIFNLVIEGKCKSRCERHYFWKVSISVFLINVIKAWLLQYCHHVEHVSCLWANKARPI